MIKKLLIDSALFLTVSVIFQFPSIVWSAESTSSEQPPQAGEMLTAAETIIKNLQPYAQLLKQSNESQPSQSQKSSTAAESSEVGEDRGKKEVRHDPDIESFARVPKAKIELRLDRQSTEGSEYTEALLALEKRDYSRARDLLIMALRMQPDHRNARLNLVRWQLLWGRKEGATFTIRPLLNEENDWQVWFWLGTAQLLTGDFDGARIALQRASDLDRTQGAIWIQKALVEEQTGDLDQALVYLKLAQKLGAENVDVHINLAYISERQNKLSSALDAYRHILNDVSKNIKHQFRREIAIERLSQLRALSTKGE